MPRPKTIHGIDPYAPGGVEAIIEYNRAMFGNAQMNANAVGEGGSGEPAGVPAGNEPTGTPANAPIGTPAPKTETPPAGAPASEKVEDLPAWAQKIIKDTRDEAAGSRTSKTAVEQQLAAIQKALNPNAKGDEKPTAEQLAKDLAARDTAAKQAQTELAIYKLAGKYGADADALLDSRVFIEKIKELDHTDTKAVTKAITDAINDNPKLKAVQAAGKSGADFSGGPGEQRTKKSMSLNEATASHYGTK